MGRFLREAGFLRHGKEIPCPRLLGQGVSAFLGRQPPFLTPGLVLVARKPKGKVEVNTQVWSWKNQGPPIFG